MAFAKKMMGFPSDLVSYSRPNSRQKDMRQFMSHFFEGVQYFNVSFILFNDFSQVSQEVMVNMVGMGRVQDVQITVFVISLMEIKDTVLVLRVMSRMRIIPSVMAEHLFKI